MKSFLIHSTSCLNPSTLQPALTSPFTAPSRTVACWRPLDEHANLLWLNRMTKCLRTPEEFFASGVWKWAAMLSGLLLCIAETLGDTTFSLTQKPRQGDSAQQDNFCHRNPKFTEAAIR